jgi:hypothetical protein
VDHQDIPEHPDIRRVPSARVDTQLARILDDAQYRGSATAITRRGALAAVVVPPGWYAAALAALAPGGES